MESEQRHCDLRSRTRAQEILQFCLIALAGLGMESAIYSQVRDRDPGSMQSPSETATISGRVVLPSGRSLSSNVKIVLSNSQNPLNTLYTDKHGEFRFANVREGIYYIEVLGDRNFFEPVTQEVRVPRAASVSVTIYLREKTETSGNRSGSGTVSAADLDQKAPASAKKEYEKASKLINKGDIQKGIEHLEQALFIYPDYLSARNDLGVQYLKLKQFEQAAEQFELTLKLNPKYFDSKLNLGLVLIEQKKYSEAINRLTEAISVDSARPAAHLWLGTALLQTNELVGAERELTKALTLGGSDFLVAHYYIAHVHLKRGERVAAARELKTYLEQSPNGEQSGDARRLLERLK